MNNNEKGQLLADAYEISNEIVQYVDRSSVDVIKKRLYIQKAEECKKKLEDVVRAAEMLREHIGIDIKTRKVNVSLFYLSARLYLLDKSVGLLIQSARNNETSSISSFKGAVYNYTNKNQLATSYNLDDSEGVDSDYKVLDVITHLDEHTSRFILNRQDEDVNIEIDANKDPFILDGNSNSFYWVMCLLIYKENKILMDRNDRLLLTELCAMKRNERDKVIGLYILCVWLLKRHRRVYSTLTDNALARVKEFVKNGEVINNLSRLTYPYVPYETDLIEDS